MDDKSVPKKKLFDTLAFVLFLVGSYTLYLKAGKWVAIGVGVEVIAMYLMIYIHFFFGKNDKDDES